MLLMWCNEGLEFCANITEIDKKIMWQTMKGEESTISLPNLNMLIMRARFNTQRHYEIYTVSVEPNITAEDLTEMFEDDPQGSADLIRDRGRKLYSDRADKSKERIV